MTNEENMTIDERYKYLRKMQGHYQQASPQERSDLLDEMERVTDLHRKSLIRLMKNKPKRHQRRQPRERSYKAEVDDALRVISESMDYVCAERLQPNLVWLAGHLAEPGELATSPEL
jgi:hypothetical protein